MKPSTILVAALMLAVSCHFRTALADADGVILKQSRHDVATTLDRLERVLLDKGMTIFKRIDHAGAARSIDIPLNDRELLIFGNPALGSKLMQCSDSVAIDLPLKALAYRDDQGKVWLAYNDPGWLSARHGIKGCDGPLGKMNRALDNFTGHAVSKP